MEINGLFETKDYALKWYLSSRMEHDRHTFKLLRNKVMSEFQKQKQTFFISITRGGNQNVKLKSNRNNIQDHNTVAQAFDNHLVSTIKTLIATHTVFILLKETTKYWFTHILS